MNSPSPPVPGSSSVLPDWRLRPAVVLGVETQIGLAIVRELGSAGVPVIAVTHDQRAIGLASRHVAQRVIVGPPRSDAVVQAINGLARTHGPVSLLTVSEGNLVWLDSRRADFDPLVHLAVPGATTLRSVLDKSLTLRAAAALGIAVPQTAQPATLGEALALADRFSFPAVLKWRDANDVMPRLSAAGISFVKAEYVYNADELRRCAQRYAPIGEWPLVQQYCRGQGLGQFFFMHHGQPVRRFQHLRVAEWPPEGGFSSVCDAVPLARHKALQAKSVALLQALNWQGVAMVEYRHDPNTGQSVLMEVNGRFWGSLPLAVAAGSGFALLAHAAAQGVELPVMPAPTEGLRCRMVATEIKRLQRLWLAPGLIADHEFVKRPVHDSLRFFADFLRPGVRYYVWSIDDPRPFLQDLRNALWRQ